MTGWELQFHRFRSLQTQWLRSARARAVAGALLLVAGEIAQTAMGSFRTLVLPKCNAMQPDATPRNTMQQIWVRFARALPAQRGATGRNAMRPGATDWLRSP